MLLKKLLVIPTFLIALTSASQSTYSYGFDFALGLSSISMKGENIDFQEKISPTGNAGLFYLTKIKNRGLFGLEVYVAQIEGRWNYQSSITDGLGNEIGVSTTEGRQHLTYITFPIYSGITINNTSCYLGLQAGIAASGKRDDTITTSINGIESSEDQLGNLSILLPDFGIRAGIIIKLSNKLSLHTKYYQGLINIFDRETTLSNFTWRTQQFTVGIRFSIRNTNDCGTCPAWGN